MQRIPLNVNDINLFASDGPGTYILTDVNNVALYVGRADVSLAERLKQHLPDREANATLKGMCPAAVWFAFCETPWDAYLMEMDLVQRYPNVCNQNKPAQPLLGRGRPLIPSQTSAMSDYNKLLALLSR